MGTQRLTNIPMVYLTEALWDSARTAAHLNIPVRTLDQWSYKSSGPRFYKVGRHRRYQPADVATWLDAHRQGGDAA